MGSLPDQEEIGVTLAVLDSHWDKHHRKTQPGHVSFLMRPPKMLIRLSSAYNLLIVGNGFTPNALILATKNIKSLPAVQTNIGSATHVYKVRQQHVQMMIQHLMSS